MNRISTRLGIQQRVLPFYRAPFFDALARECRGGLCIFAGQPREGEALGEEGKLSAAQYTPARNRHFFNGKSYLCWQSGYKEWLQNWQPEVLIVEANPRYLGNPLAVRWMHSRDRKVIGWGLGAPPLHGMTGLKERLWKYFLGNFDAMITYSQKGAQEYQSAGLAADCIFVAANAASPRPQHAMPDRLAEFSNDGALILFVGRLQARKRVDLLIHACSKLGLQDAPRLVIVGDGPERASLEALAMQIYPRAQFTGSLRGESLANIFRKADLFVLPGTGGLAIQEAMSYGLPVMVAEADGTQNDLVRSGNGWMLPPGDQDALISGLRLAMGDPLRLRRMGVESYRIVSEEINLEKMIDVFLQAIDFVVTR